MGLADMLLRWYDINKREMPWRINQDAYRIWVSEIMLQQTRVETVKPYFEKWMERFPTLADLAAADEEEVVRYWQGLGYYSRARNLLAGVREVSAVYGGKFPADKTAALKIAGIGEYTAGAILSIAYNRKEAAIDGNVLRVFSRLYCEKGDITSPPVKRAIRLLVEQEMSAERPGDFNQAVMDLGATICIPQAPRCEACPVVELCCARQANLERELPVKKAKSAPVPVDLAAAIICWEGFVLLRKRPDTGLLAGMWEFPAVELSDQAGGVEQLGNMLQSELYQTVSNCQLVLQLEHVFSHRHWKLSFYTCQLQHTTALPPESRSAWVAVSELASVTFAGPHAKAARWLLQNN